MKSLQVFLLSLVVLGFASNGRADVIELGPGSSIQVGTNVVRCSGSAIGVPQIMGGIYRHDYLGEFTVTQELNVVRVIDRTQKIETYRCDTFGICLANNNRDYLQIINQKRLKLVFPSKGEIYEYNRIDY